MYINPDEYILCAMYAKDTDGAFFTVTVWKGEEDSWVMGASILNDPKRNKMLIREFTTEEEMLGLAKKYFNEILKKQYPTTSRFIEVKGGAEKLERILKEDPNYGYPIRVTGHGIH